MALFDEVFSTHHNPPGSSGGRYTSHARPEGRLNLSEDRQMFFAASVPPPRASIGVSGARLADPLYRWLLHRYRADGE